MILYYICINTIGQFLNKQWQINCSTSHSVLSSLHRKHVKEKHREDKEGDDKRLQEAVVGMFGGWWSGGTVCGRPLAHTPASLSTLLSLLMLGSPAAPALLPESLCVPA